MKYYIINTTFPYKGVSSCQIRSFLSEERLNTIKNNWDLIKDVYSKDSKVELAFNDIGIKIDIEYIILMVNNAKEINLKEIDVLKKYPVLSIEIISEFMDDFLSKGLELYNNTEKFLKITEIYQKVF